MVLSFLTAANFADGEFSVLPADAMPCPRRTMRKTVGRGCDQGRLKIDAATKIRFRRLQRRVQPRDCSSIVGYYPDQHDRAALPPKQ